VPIILLTSQDDPRDASQFVGHRDRNDIGIGSGFELGEPRAERVTIPCDSVLNGTAAMNEKPPKILITVLANSEKLRLASCRALLWNEPQPSRELPPAGERCAIPNRRYNGCSDQYANSGHRDQPLAGRVLGSDRLDFAIELFDLFFNQAPLSRDQA
jgi:hypothetical protein